MEIQWPSPHLVIVKTGNRTLRISGEGLFGGDLDFVIYPSFITHWDDGGVVTDEERVEVLDEVVNEATRHSLKFEIAW